MTTIEDRIQTYAELGIAREAAARKVAIEDGRIGVEDMTVPELEAFMRTPAFEAEARQYLGLPNLHEESDTRSLAELRAEQEAHAEAERDARAAEQAHNDLWDVRLKAKVASQDRDAYAAQVANSVRRGMGRFADEEAVSSAVSAALVKYDESKQPTRVDRAEAELAKFSRTDLGLPESD